jgi:uncharacterized protein YbaP (TraB family)
MLLATRPIRVFISERDLAEPVASALQQLPAGEQLSTLLAQQAGLYERIVAILTRYRLPAAAAEHFKPWFAAALLNQIAAMPQDRTVKIFDEYLLHSVRELGIETRFLEKFSDIAGYYEQNFSADEQIRLLWEAVCNQKVLEQLTRLQTQAYAANRVGEFYRLLQRYSGSDKVLSDKLVDVFVQQRNAAFWQELRPQLQQGGAFIAIGSLHVLGEDGLLQRLEQEPGLRVRSIELQDLSFTLAADTVASAMTWVLDRTRTEPETAAQPEPGSWFADLQIQHRSIPQLHEQLCPGSGRKCTVEATYIPGEKTIFLADPVFAKLLAASAEQPQHYSRSLLIRELSRHLLYQTKAPGWQQHLQMQHYPQVQRCLKNAILHRASVLQAGYLQEQQSDRSVHIFPLDPRCPDLPGY